MRAESVRAKSGGLSALIFPSDPALLLFVLLKLPKFIKFNGMGLVYSNIGLSNPVKPELKSIDVRCLADSGSTYLVIPQHITRQLQLQVLETREATTADGSSHTVPYAGLYRSVSKIEIVLWGHLLWETKYCWARFQWRIWTS
jgi:hypothetical protein